MEDRLDRSKYVNLIRNILSQKYPIQFIIDTVLKHIHYILGNEEQSIVQCVTFETTILIMEKYLRFGWKQKGSCSDMGNTSISVNSLSKDKSNSFFGNAFGMFSQGNCALDVSILMQQFALNCEMEAKINNFIELYTKNYSKIKNKLNITVKINALKLIKTSMVVQQSDMGQKFI